MRKAEDIGDILSELQAQVPNAARWQSDVLLAATRFARPFAQLRANQARMEAVRAELRDPDDATLSASNALADAADRQVANLDSQMERLRIVQPETCADSVSVYGYVRDGGKPLVGVSVALTDGAKVFAEIASDKDGSFALSVCAEELLGIDVRKGRSIIWHDPKPRHAPGRVAAYRIIEIGEAKEPRPTQDPPKGDCTPHPEIAPDPVKEPVAEPAKEPVRDPVKEPVREPVKQVEPPVVASPPVVDRAAIAVATPVATKSVAGPVAGSVAKAAPKPAAKPTAKAAAKPRKAPAPPKGKA